MIQNEVDPAPEQEHSRKQILELLRHVAREMVRRIAAASNNSPRDAGTVSLKQGSAQHKENADAEFLWRMKRYGVEIAVLCIFYLIAGGFRHDASSNFARLSNQIDEPSGFLNALSERITFECSAWCGAVVFLPT